MNRVAWLLLILPLWAIADRSCDTSLDSDRRYSCYLHRYCGSAETTDDQLACHIQIIQDLLAAPSEPDPAAPLNSPAEAQVPDVREEGRLRQLFGSNRTKGERHEGRIVRLVEQPLGNFLVLLDDGQAWEQLEREAVRLKTGQRVAVVRGAMGTYALLPTDGGRARVRALPCPSEKCAALGVTQPSSATPR
ncbi:MAG: hypothetical protein ACNA7W_06930 [Pseudomonadales bacterium]